MRRTCYIAAATALLLALAMAGAWSFGKLSWGPTGQGASSRMGGVAVLDLDAVAKQIGADVVLEKQITDMQTSLDDQLRSLQASYRKQYAEKAKELQMQRDPNAPAPNGSVTAKQQLADLEKKLNLQLIQAQQNARNKFNAYRSGLFKDFRDEVVPVAQKVAGQHGLGVVLTKNNAVLLAFDESYDITNEVATELRNGRSATSGEQAATAAARSSSNLR